MFFFHTFSVLWHLFLLSPSLSFFRHIILPRFSVPQWWVLSRDLPSNRLYFEQPANEIKKNTSLKQAAFISKSKSDTQTAVIHLLNDWSCMFLVCMGTVMSVLWCCLINTAAGLWWLKIHSTTWFIRLSLETLLRLSECSRGLMLPWSYSDSTTECRGREKSWWNFIMLLCKCNFCDKPVLEESQQTQKMISTQMEFVFQKTCGTG